MRMFSSPFSVDIESVPTELQLEFVDLQCDSVVKSKFFEIPTIDFYPKYVSKKSIHKFVNVSCSCLLFLEALTYVSSYSVK